MNLSLMTGPLSAVLHTGHQYYVELTWTANTMKSYIHVWDILYVLIDLTLIVRTVALNPGWETSGSKLIQPCNNNEATNVNKPSQTLTGGCHSTKEFSISLDSNTTHGPVH